MCRPRLTTGTDYVCFLRVHGQCFEDGSVAITPMHIDDLKRVVEALPKLVATLEQAREKLKAVKALCGEEA